jgi:hypothetical protein
MGYQTPIVVDHGSLVEMTQILSIAGPVEDSGNKAIPFHHTPPATAPSGP